MDKHSADHDQNVVDLAAAAAADAVAQNQLKRLSRVLTILTKTRKSWWEKNSRRTSRKFIGRNFFTIHR